MAHIATGWPMAGSIRRPSGGAIVRIRSASASHRSRRPERQARCGPPRRAAWRVDLRANTTESRHIPMRMVTIFFLAAALLMPSPVVLAATSCTSIRCQCKQEREASIEACREACAGYSDVKSAQQGCQDSATARLDDCTGKCKPIPADPSGHCQPTFDCVEHCETLRTRAGASCNRVFARSWRPLRAQCSTFKDCKQAAKDAFKQCLDNGGPATAPAAARVAAEFVLAPAAAPPCLAPNPQKCVNEALNCVAQTLRSCYSDCGHKCHRNATATSICERGCRDGHCLGLGPCKQHYNNCCLNDDPTPGNQIPLPEGANCTPTTTSTSVTSTTSTLASTTTSTSTTTTTTLGP